MDLTLEGKEFIESHENEALKNRVGQFLLDKENLLIDGQQLRPILDRTALVKYTMTGYYPSRGGPGRSRADSS